MRKTGTFLVVGLSVALNAAFIGRTLAPRKQKSSSSAETLGRTDVFAHAPGTPAEIVFAGDSIVERGPWAELLGRKILNRGVDGERTSGLLARLGEIRRHHPRLLIVLSGINDIRAGVEPSAVISNLERIARSGVAKRIVFLSLLPVSGPEAKWQGHVDQTNAELALRVRGWGAGIVPTGPTTSYDGLHPDGAGYLAISERIQESGVFDSPIPVR